MPDSLADLHPSPELLQRFRSGELHGPDADAVKGHVEACAMCGQKLREKGSGNESTGTLLITDS